MPIFLNLMLLFAILQFISERMRDLDAKKKKRREMEATAHKKRDSPDLAEKGSALDTKSDTKSFQVQSGDTNASQGESDAKKAEVQVDIRPAPVDIEVDMVTPEADEKKSGILINTDK